MEIREFGDLGFGNRDLGDFGLKKLEITGDWEKRDEEEDVGFLAFDVGVVFFIGLDPGFQVCWAELRVYNKRVYTIN